MDLDDFAKGAVAALLTDQVNAKTGLAYKVGWLVTGLAIIGTIAAGGWLRWLAVVVVVVGLGFLFFVFVTKRLAGGLINRLAPPADLSDARQHFDAAIAEADIPTDPLGFLRMVWRLRKGVGPEIERLGAVVTRLRGRLD